MKYLINTKQIKWNEIDKGCWICSSHCKNKQGYPQVQRNGKRMLLSKLIFEMNYGPVPVGQCVCHLCDNPGCINPEHLFLGTHQDNMADMVSKKRHAYGERNGHAKLTETDVRNIFNLLGKGIKQKAIAKQYKIDPSAISHIKRHAHWAIIGVNIRQD